MNLVMLPRPAIASPSPQFTTDMSREDLDAACEAIAARGGETGEIACRILAVSKRFDVLIAQADEFLNRYRK